MYRATVIFTASVILSGFIGGKVVLASAVNSSPDTKETVVRSGEPKQERQALQQLAVALEAGAGTWNPFYRAKIDNEETKQPLEPGIPDMDCRVDEIADYVSCYGSPIASKKEAERRFTGFIDELQAVLPSERWQGAETEPRSASIRSYTYLDQDSDAQIDIDIAPRWSPDEEISYVVTIFGWTAIGPRL
jgi:hypothetical protein